jgi:hypothetical protein
MRDCSSIGHLGNRLQRTKHETRVLRLECIFGPAVYQDNARTRREGCKLRSCGIALCTFSALLVISVRHIGYDVSINIFYQSTNQLNRKCLMKCLRGLVKMAVRHHVTLRNHIVNPLISRPPIHPTKFIVPSVISNRHDINIVFTPWHSFSLATSIRTLLSEG